MGSPLLVDSHPSQQHAGNILLVVPTETTESKPVKLETSGQSYKAYTIIIYKSES